MALMEEAGNLIKTIIFHASDKESLLKSVTLLCDAIKTRTDADHKLFFSVLGQDFYVVNRADLGDDGKPHFVGHHEIIFMLKDDRTAQRLIELKRVLYYRNCMCFVGDSEEKQARTQELINWLLETKEEINL